MQSAAPEAVDLSRETEETRRLYGLDRKVTALRGHRSQTTGLIELMGEDRYARWVSVESFASAFGASFGVAVINVPLDDRSGGRTLPTLTV